MPQPIAYLSFNGNCEQAMRFYERVLDGKLEALMRNGDLPCADQPPPEQHHLVMPAWPWKATECCMAATARRTCHTKESKACRSR